MQDIVKRSPTLAYVTAVSSFTCSRMRPDGFGGAAVVITSHDLAHGLALSDRVVVLARGRVQLASVSRDFTPEAFAARYAEAVA